MYDQGYDAPYRSARLALLLRSRTRAERAPPVSYAKTDSKGNFVFGLQEKIPDATFWVTLASDISKPLAVVKSDGGGNAESGIALPFSDEIVASSLVRQGGRGNDVAMDLTAAALTGN